MSFDVNDTIAAIASPSGPAVRGILRLSGPQTLDCLANIFSAKSPDSANLVDDLKTVSARSVIRGNLKIDEQTSLEGDLLIWPDQRSYTRQPTAEFHTIGSPVLLKMALANVCRHGARLAGPGEFTLRAFLSGRIDLTQAEAVLAVIDSADQRQLDHALQQLAGGLAGPLSEIRDSLLSLLAELEAGLDFVEEDIEFISQTELENGLAAAQNKLSELLAQISSREISLEDFNVVLSGLPNAGKSSLFNALIENPLAIVTDIKGTTRDYITAPLFAKRDPDANEDSSTSTAIQLIDTAGVEEATALSPAVELQLPNDDSGSQIPHETGQPTISQSAQELGRDKIESADLILFCVQSQNPLTDWHRDQIANSDSARTIVVLTKSDLGGEEKTDSIRQLGFNGQVVSTSSVDLSGINQLRHAIQSVCVESQNSESPIVATTVVRVSDSLLDSAKSITLALQTARSQAGLELVAAEVRTALDSLGRVVGTIYTDDILDLVFGRFCIGK